VKGQKSLEMIIGLVMLLVVASVTISMFLNVFQEPELGDETVEKQKIQKECSSHCNDFKESNGRNQLSAALQYCKAKFERDVTGDGTSSGIAGSGYNSYCEDGIKCFNVHTCEIGLGETLDAQKCRSLMCEYYTEVSNNPYNPSQNRNVHDRIQKIMSPENEETGIGTCGLEDATDSAGYEISTWYDPANQNYTFAGGSGPDPSGNDYTCSQETKSGSSPLSICNTVGKPTWATGYTISSAQCNDGNPGYTTPYQVGRPSASTSKTSPEVDNACSSGQNVWCKLNSTP
jgi:hypothetical protein